MMGYYYHIDYLEIIRDYTTPITVTDYEGSSVSCSFVTMRKKRSMMFVWESMWWLVVTFINRMNSDDRLRWEGTENCFVSFRISMCGKV